MKPFTFGSVCSGIEAASVAWEPLGWKAAFVAEIDPFPSAVLAHRYPGVSNLGDFTTIVEGSGPIDLLVGGTPCQSFSVAGLRKGMADSRGNLALEFLRLAGRLRPEWVVWENVPGVLSSNKGRDLGAFLGGLVELGYGFAYRVLDAQFFGVPQRRRRVFVVGHLGDWRRAAAVLFERHSLSGNPPPSREAGAVVTSSLTRSLGSGGACAGRAQAHHLTAFSSHGHGQFREGVGICTAHDAKDGLQAGVIAHTLRADGFDASEDGTGRGTPLVACTLSSSNGGVSSGYHPVVPVAFNWQTSGNQTTLGCDETGTGSLSTSTVPAIAYQCQGSNVGPMGTLRSGNGNETGGVPFVADVAFACATQDRRVGQGWNANMIGSASAVRRLTPRECERLQGFPDDWTLVPYRGKAAADGPRYKAIGNSMAVPCMRWIGRRILEAVND